MRIDGERIYIRTFTKLDINALFQYTTLNRKFFQPYDPIRPEVFFTVDGQLERIDMSKHAFENGTSYAFGIFGRSSDELVGKIELSGVARGPFQNANLGYSVSETHNGKGYATAAVGLILEFAFNHIELHRVQAGTLPSNIGSIKVLSKNGFRYEGLAQRYLKINGVWEDHNLYAITCEEWAK